MSDTHISTYQPFIRRETQTASNRIVTATASPAMPNRAWYYLQGRSYAPLTNPFIPLRKRRFPALLDRHTRRRMQLETAARRRNEKRYHYRDYAEFVRMDMLEAAALRGGAL